MINKEFKTNLEKIFFHVARYGAVAYISENNISKDFNHQRFYELCNEGFKIAQTDILTEIKILQTVQKSLNNELKEERRKRNKSKIGELTSKIKVENYKEELLRNLTLTIAWQIFNGKREFIARFYTGEKGTNETEGKGFEAILQAAEDINQHVDRFALISDLTNNIQIGDLLVIYPEKLEIVEIKIGKKK